MKLAVFDVDGTLIDTKVGTFKDLGLMLGKEEEIKAHHEEYERRKHLGPWGLDELAELFKGTKEGRMVELSKQIVDQMLMPGAEEIFKELKGRGYTLLAYSSSPTFIMEILRNRFGFSDIHGNVLEVKGGTLTGKLAEKADRHTKAERLKKFMEENSIFQKDVYVIGDSVTDLPMAEYGHFIAFNADKEEVKEKAEYVVDKKDLREILKYIK